MISCNYNGLIKVLQIFGHCILQTSQIVVTFSIYMYLCFGIITYSTYIMSTLRVIWLACIFPHFENNLHILPIQCYSGHASGKEPICQCRRHKRHGFNPWSARSSGEGNDYPLQYSCLENLMDRGPWQATVHSISKS